MSKRENPDVIINIVDATNLSRSLFFTTQLLELRIPVVVALNKSDINAKKETRIDTKLLSEKLGCPVVETVSTSAEGLKAVVEKAVEVAHTAQAAPYHQGDIDLTSKKAVEQADRQRFTFVNEIVDAVETRKILTREKNFGDKIDAILTNKWLGIPIFAVVMFFVFQISQVWVGTPIADWMVGWLETFQSWVGGLLENASPILSALLVDGVIGGVIAVIGFLPLVMVMYFLIALLEDCGYMSRVAVVLDPIFKRVGLSGKSVIPFVITIGCAVPGIMASRTIRNERERRATAMLAPFMPCGAKIPVIALFAGAFFDDAGWVSTLMYLTGIVLIFVGALLVNKIAAIRPESPSLSSNFAEYKVPSLWGAFKSMCSRGKAYIRKAATIILLCNTAVQIMQTFDWHLGVAETADASILASIAGPFAWLLVPIVASIPAAASCQEWTPTIGTSSHANGPAIDARMEASAGSGDTKVPVKGLHDLYSSVAQQDDGCSLADIRLATAATIILLCNTAVQIMQTFDWHLGVAETADASILASIAGPFAWLLVRLSASIPGSWQLPGMDADNRDQQPCKRSGNRRKDGSVRCFGDTKVPVKGLHDLYSSVAQQDDGCSRGKAYIRKAATIILLCNTAVADHADL